jgi:hypothetical protein
MGDMSCREKMEMLGGQTRDLLIADQTLYH